MTILDYIFLGLTIAGLAVILFITFRKFPQISAVKPDSVPDEADKAKKKNIIEQRLDRKFNTFFQKIKDWLKPVISKSNETFKKVIGKLYALEKQYTEKIQESNRAQTPGQLKSKISKMFEEAKELAKDNKYKDAEKLYIKIISLDKENTEAFELLGELYIKIKEYNFAHETFAHLLRIDPENALVYHDLGLLAQRQGNISLAIKNWQKALDIEPNNPKIIDSLLEAAIQSKNKVLAYESLDKLKEINPENQKIADFAEKVEQLEKELKIKK